MTLAELRAEVFRRIEEESGSPVFWTADDVDLALNEGYAEFSDIVGFNNTTLSISQLEDRLYYDLRNYLASGQTLLHVDAIWNATSSTWMSPYSLRDLDFLRAADWDTASGQPFAYFVRGAWWLGLWPIPEADDATASLTALVSTIPATLTASDSPSIHEDYQYALVEYAHYDLLTQDKEPKKALSHFKRFLELVEEYRRFTADRAAPDQHRVLGVGAI